jgi:A/G-specific adenine glycosylase
MAVRHDCIDIPAATVIRIRRNLLRWFRDHGREMAWRRTSDPYRIWISEVLLQQTTVRAVGPYYRRFVRRFPTLRRLAAAPLPEVLREWSGLGYYARARNLRKAAQQIVRQHRGRIPAARDELLALPGVGPYTAAALMSFVHGKPEAVVDGNVARILTRLFLVGGNPRSGAVMGRLRDLADRLVAPRRSRDFNLAMMDLGSAVCRPKSPRCADCPLRGACRARAAGAQELYPELPSRRKPVRVEQLVAVIHRAGRLFLVPRPEDGLLGGMWEFPGCDGNGAGRAAGARLSGELSRRWRLPVRAGGELAVAEHRITYRRIRVRAIRASILPGGKIPEGEWIRRRDLSRYPITTATRKILAGLEQRRPGLKGQRPARPAAMGSIREGGS